MTPYIKNKKDLFGSKARNDTLEIIEAGLRAVDTGTVLREEFRVIDGVVTVGDTSYRLADYEHIYIIGFGKVACVAANVLEQLLDGHVKEGAVVGIKEHVCAVVDTYAGTHPLPSIVNVTATKHIEAIARQATERDLVLVIVSGGGSALLCSSMSEVAQGVRLFNSFLSSGGTIEELNTVRKHISTLKGGGLAAALYPSTVISLIFSDVPGGDLAMVASGPTFYDHSTVEEAAAIIEKYNLGDFTLVETPKDPALFANIHNVPVVSNRRALAAMRATAEKLGYQAKIHSDALYATPEEIATYVKHHNKPGTAWLCGGETRLSIPKGSTGSGGRNDHTAVYVLPYLAPQQVFAAVASDGYDNTDMAGAIVDQAAAAKVAQLGLDQEQYIQSFDSYPFCQALNVHINTGLLSSNVADLLVLTNAQKTEAPIATHSKTSQKLRKLSARVVKDSRGRPTISVTAHVGDHQGTFSVPSGASTGEREVCVVPVKMAIRTIDKQLASALRDIDVLQQAEVDAIMHELDPSDQFDVIGGNTTLGVSVAIAKAAAASQGKETWQYIRELFDTPPQANRPRLFVNLINGGVHASFGSQIQEHQIIPETDNPYEAFRVACAVQRTLRDVLREQYTKHEIGIGDEGGFVIPSETPDEPFQFLLRAIAETDVSCEVSLGTDIAASSFVKTTGYYFNNTHYTGRAFVDEMLRLCNRFPTLRYIEDPADQHDYEIFRALQAAEPNRMVIGDDLTTSNEKLLQSAITKKAISGVIVKPNQVGTLSDTLNTMRLAYAHNVACVVSHRSGETDDDFIADLAYGTGSFGLKAGAPTASERLVKYQRLLKICQQ